MKTFPISVDDFLKELVTPQNPNGKITVNAQWLKDGSGNLVLDAQGNKIDASTYTMKRFDGFGNPLPDETHPVPLRTDIKANLAEWQDILAKSQAEITVINQTITNYQTIDALYDSMAPQ
jgi:hypothetical protein